ncbi:MAG: pyruvate kinase [Deltaproteobacteria bacterium]|jgi:pyruvate kinase|nr:pyruvate kinase [Deltaproteobacteria bacterium]MCW8892966.1 pyruvate kinase [Deltaproteobacteria bacterium]MCW9048841.1 pyruvate kinase [Deltaproteobacteria bacterium]
MYRRSKIVATVGPSCEQKDQLEDLLKAGVDVFRLNFSHGELEQKAEWIQQIREISIKHKKAVSILGDLQGPKIRTGLMRSGQQKLEVGQDVVITTAEVAGADGVIPTTYQALPQDVVVGNQILLDDGRLELEVVKVVAEQVYCRVIIGGLLKDRKGINLPGVKVSAPALTEKDLADLDFAISQELDWVALSFVRTAEDVIRLKQILFERKSPIRVIAKIEKPEAVENFSTILQATDGVMVARGDLGVEIPSERVPLIQKMIIRKCNQLGKPVITATQMLESMIGNPRPTRAETSDVANAILDGSDAVMLSGETAAGLYPVQAVQVMDRVARDVERDPELGAKRPPAFFDSESQQSLPDAIGQAACQVAEAVGATAILAFTQTGSTAALVAKHRPSLPIFAVTPTQQVRRHLALYGGIHSLRVDIQGDTESQILSVEDAVLNTGLLKRGEVVVITMGSPVSAPGTTNLLKIHRLGTGDFYEVHGAPYRA